MISKERLQKLVTQKATIWADSYGEIQLCDESHFGFLMKSKKVGPFPYVVSKICLAGFIHNGELYDEYAVEIDKLEEKEKD